MVPFIDFHTHHWFAPTKEAIAVRSYRVGSELTLHSAKPTPIYMAGIHPWDSGEVDLAAGIEMIRSLNPDAIGEIGLDYVHSDSRDIQLDTLQAQLILAEEIGKPVVLHCVKAFEEIMPLLAVRKNITAIAFHSYIGGPQQTARLISAGYYASFSDTSLRSPKTIESLKNIPIDKLFLESDDSGADIGEIYLRAAALLGTTTTELKVAIYENFKTFFKL